MLFLLTVKWKKMRNKNLKLMEFFRKILVVIHTNNHGVPFSTSGNWLCQMYRQSHAGGDGAGGEKCPPQQQKLQSDERWR